jgi:4-phosphopantoate--beta-alanine ligase
MIPRNHPRHESLALREKIAAGVRDGIVHPTGLIAHGRGEAFDYLLGEQTLPFATDAASAIAAHLSCANRPVISVNGNVAVLAADDIVKLAEETDSCIEVNLFHRTEERVEKVCSLLENRGGTRILGREGDAKIPGLLHDRAVCSREGIYAGDVIVVPLEDGDRCEALKHMGKTVLTVDLNPLSRTARTADVTMVDNLVRALPAIGKARTELDNPQDIINAWDNVRALQRALEHICMRLYAFFDAPRAGR